MRILFLTDNFVPENNAPAIRTFEHAKQWVARGADVTVVTGAPNFPSGVLFEGYQNALWQSEIIDGIKVVRVWTFMAPNRGVFLRLLDFLSFMISSLIVGLFLKKPDVIIGTSPQFFTVVSAWVLARCKRCLFIFEIRDIWPDSVFAVNLKVARFLVSLASKTAAFLYRQADGIVVVTKATLDFLVSRGVDPAKILLIPNGVELHRFQGTCEKNVKLAETLGIPGRFVIGYIGTHGLAHALENVIEAAELITKEENIRIVFAGGGADRSRLEKIVSERGLENIVMIPRQPKDQMPQVWSLCDISLVHLKDIPLFKTVIPSKIFESMAMGLPIIMAVPIGEATDIIEEYKAGISVSPGCPIELSEKFLELATDKELVRTLSYHSLNAARNFDRKKLALEMLNYIDGIVS